jgi:uncharacterized protein
MIMPASCTVRGDDVVLVSPTGARVRCAGRGDVVVVGVDGYDPRTGEGWAVSVIGPSRLLTDEAEIATLDRLGLRPAALREELRYIVVRMGVLRGCRLVRAAGSRPLLR